jgi:hypothetical protein
MTAHQAAMRNTKLTFQSHLTVSSCNPMRRLRQSHWVRVVNLRHLVCELRKARQQCLARQELVQQSLRVACMPRLYVRQLLRHHRHESLSRCRENVTAFAFEKRVNRAFDGALAESAEPLVCWHARPAPYVAPELFLCQVMIGQQQPRESDAVLLCPHGEVGTQAVCFVHELAIFVALPASSEQAQLRRVADEVASVILCRVSDALEYVFEAFRCQ